MDYERSKYCRRCGAPLKEGEKACESCGAKVPDEKPRQTEVPDSPEDSQKPDESATVFDTPPYAERTKVSQAFELPETDYPPKVQVAASNAWAILTQDIVSGLVVFILFMIISMGSSYILPFIGPLILSGPMEVGFLGWAEAKRRGKAANADVLFRTGFGNFKNAFILELVMMLFGFLWFALFGIGFLSLLNVYFSPMGGLQQIFTGQPRGPFGYSPFSSGLPSWVNNIALPSSLTLIMVGLGVIAGLITGPILNSIKNLAGWAISQGKPFPESWSWAWKRVKKHFFTWWWAGVAIPIGGVAGYVFCGIGLAFSIPWMYLAIAELAGNVEEDD